MAELTWDGKYDSNGNKVAPLRVSLPFQTVETINESAQERQHMLDLFNSGRDQEWRNRLIWGDKKYVLPSLLEEFAGKVNLIYIDPPFNTGADFSYHATIPGPQHGGADDELGFLKEPSAIEQKAYRDTWGRGLDSYLRWFYETAVLLRDLLAEDGSIYVHLDWHLGHYARVVLDEVFQRDNFRNEIYWYYYNKMPDIRKGVFPRSTDTLFFYVKDRGAAYAFNPPTERREEPVKQLARKKVNGQMVNVRDEEGKVVYRVREDRIVDNVWRLPMLQPADKTENLRYPTQKPEALLERLMQASSNENDLVLDCFCGSGTMPAVAERIGRRWIACDLSRFAIHTTRKRLLSSIGVRPFVVQNLGKYERQAWQVAEFGGRNSSGSERASAVHRAYVGFILGLYRAKPISGYTWLHGVRSGRMVHVGAVDAPVSIGDVSQILAEFKKAIGTATVGEHGELAEQRPSVNGLEILGWDFAFELNEVARQQAAQSKVNMRFYRIPRDVMDKRAVEQGDIRFFELAALSVEAKLNKRTLTLALTDFVIPVDDVPEDVQKAIRHWSQWIDYWAVDWDYRGDAFHNEWQAYRTRQEPGLRKEAAHTYESAGAYTVLVKVIDILGNDTTKSISVKVK